MGMVLVACVPSRLPGYTVDAAHSERNDAAMTHRLDLLRRDMALRDQLVRIDLATCLVLGDVLVHLRLRELRLVLQEQSAGSSMMKC